MAVNKKISRRSTAGFGSLRRIFHTTMLIDSILRAEESANESAGHARVIQFGYWHQNNLLVVFADHKLYKIPQGRQLFS